MAFIGLPCPINKTGINSDEIDSEAKPLSVVTLAPIIPKVEACIKCLRFMSVNLGI
jgi:hypothetical protein